MLDLSSIQVALPGAVFELPTFLRSTPGSSPHVQYIRTTAARLTMILMWQSPCASVIGLYQGSKYSEMFQGGFLAETNKIMSLLLPRSDAPRRKWLQRESKEQDLDNSVLACPYLKASERTVKHFDYYRDRLIILREVFEEHEPRSILQYWRDDRKLIQWWPFWIAITVFVLTLIGYVEGALQVYKRLNPAGNSTTASICTKTS